MTYRFLKFQRIRSSKGKRWGTEKKWKSSLATSKNSGLPMSFLLLISKKERNKVTWKRWSISKNRIGTDQTVLGRKCLYMLLINTPIALLWKTLLIKKWSKIRLWERCKTSFLTFSEYKMAKGEKLKKYSEYWDEEKYKVEAKDSKSYLTNRGWILP